MFVCVGFFFGGGWGCQNSLILSDDEWHQVSFWRHSLCGTVIAFSIGLVILGSFLALICLFSQVYMFLSINDTHSVCMKFQLQDEPAGRILELCILHLAMAEITSIGTRHQIVINEVSHPPLSEPF